MTDQEIIFFMGICKARGLNPFAKDCYLIKYSTDPAAIVTSIDFYRSRAKAEKDCEGWESGVVCLQTDGTLRYSKGIVLPNETLVGGWFRAKPLGWATPFELEVNLEGYIKKTSSGEITKFWRKENQPTMIRKVAESQGLREVFPDPFRGTITAEEIGELSEALTTSGELLPEAKGGAALPADIDTSKFDNLVLEKLKNLDLEAKTIRAIHLGEFLKDWAKQKSTKKAPVTVEELMVSAADYFEPYVVNKGDSKGQQRPGAWKTFLDWEAHPDRPWNQPGEEAQPPVVPGAEGGPAEKAEAVAAAGDDDPGAGSAEETFKQRVARLWGMVTEKSPTLKDMKAACGVTNLNTITPENIGAFETFIVGYEKK